MNFMPRFSKETTVTLLIFVFLFALHIPYIGSSPYEYDSWRQSDTEAIARNFVEARFNIFFPQLNYQGPLPNYVQLELQVIPFLVAILYKCFGYHYELARIIPVLFFLGSALFVYLTARRYYSLRTAWLALLLYGTVPVNLLYSRAIMPESAALFFFTGAFYFFSEWIRLERFSILITAAVFTSFAVLEKVPTVFVVIPMAAMALVKYKKRVLFKREFVVFTLIALVPAVLYYLWLQMIAESAFVSGIATKHIIPQMLTSIFTEKAQRFFIRDFPRTFTWYIVILGIGGYFATPWKKDFPIKCFALAMALELVTIAAVIQFNYYLIFFGPPLVLCAAAFLDRLIQSSFAGKMLSCIVLVLFAASAYRQVHPLIGAQDEKILKQARIVETITDKKDLIVSGVDDPSLLNASHRAGWRVMNSIPADPVAELNYFVAGGARYFVPLNGYIENDPEGRLKHYLVTHFTKIEAEKGYEIYKLTAE